MAAQVEANQGGCISCQELPATFEHLACVRHSVCDNSMKFWLYPTFKGVWHALVYFEALKRPHTRRG